MTEKLMPTDREVRIALQAVRDGLLSGAIPAENYDQTDIAYPYDNDGKPCNNVCGTSQCIAGWARFALARAGYDAEMLDSVGLWRRAWGYERRGGYSGQPVLFAGLSASPRSGAIAIKRFLNGDYANPWGFK